MKSLFKIAFFVMTVAGVCNLQADVLFWQLEDNPHNDQYAAVRVEGNGITDPTYLMLLDGPNGEAIGQAIEASDAIASPQYADITAYHDSGYQFYIEMLNYDETADTVTRGYVSPTKYTYNQLKDSGYVSSGAMSVGTVNTWTASVQIPEPTSGLLLLVGGSLLALRRRRRS